MTWIEKKKWFERQGGNGKKPKALVAKPDHQTYTVADIARLLKVDKRTVMNWLLGRDGMEPVLIEKTDWFRLPGTGYIRIREIALKKLTNLF